jgi:hypothetical protein
LWYIASSKLTFNIDTTVFVGKYKIEWLKDNIYGVSFFRIVSNRNPNLNKLLINRHLELINSLFRGCNCDAENFKPFEIIETGANIISYSFKNGICYCYSATHPVWGEETDNLDLQRDKVLDFDEVFAFSKTNVPNQEKQSLEWSTYRQEFLASKIIEFLKKIGYSHWSEMAIEGEQKAFLLATNNRIEIKQKAKLVTRFMSIELEQQSTLFSLYQTVLEPLYLPESQTNRFILMQLETGLFGSYTFETPKFSLELLEFQLSPNLFLENKYFMTGVNYKDHEITLKKEDTLVREMRVFKL